MVTVWTCHQAGLQLDQHLVDAGRLAGPGALAAARGGKVSVLIGSTQKMGVGINVQLRDR
jgi:hypothetical protein